MGFCHYDHIHSLWWTQMREVILKIYGNECVVCEKASDHNEVHHESYEHINTPLEILDCIVVCREHHQGLHNTNQLIEKERQKPKRTWMW